MLKINFFIIIINTLKYIGKIDKKNNDKKK